MTGLPFDDVTISALQATMVVALTKYQDETPLSPDVPDGRKLGILVSEVGEVADAMIGNHHNKELITELIQTAAMALSWAQCLDTPGRHGMVPLLRRYTPLPRL